MPLRVKLGLLLSQALNVALRGDPDESLSARAWRERREAWVRRIDRALGANHCRLTYLQQQQRAAFRSRVSVKA